MLSVVNTEVSLGKRNSLPIYSKIGMMLRITSKDHHGNQNNYGTRTPSLSFGIIIISFTSIKKTQLEGK